jgi:hypothetical protein
VQGGIRILSGHDQLSAFRSITSAATKVSAAAKQQYQYNDNQDQFHCSILVWDARRPATHHNALLVFL